MVLPVSVQHVGGAIPCVAYGLDFEPLLPPVVSVCMCVWCLSNGQVSMQRINHRLRRFVGMSKLKKVALNVIAQQLTEKEIGHLRGVSG